MKLRTFNQQGFGHLAIVFVIVFVGVVGFAGYKVLQGNKAEDTVTSTSNQTKAPDSIESKADLEQTKQALDGSGGQVDGGLNDSQLDADLNDML